MELHTSSAPSRRFVMTVLSVLLLAATIQRGWNAYTIPPLKGYDVAGHLGYIHTIVKDHRLPHPLEGWSTFHPPLYYLMASSVWWSLEPLGPGAAVVGVRAIGALAGIAAGLVAFAIVRRLGGDAVVALVGAALVLFIPCNQMAGNMIGNEALAAGLAALALPSLLALQADPRDRRAAAVTGLLAGMALAAKFTGFYLAGACMVPFLRKDFDRRVLGALAIVVVLMGAVAGPVYVRNVALTGSPVPMTRELEPMRTVESWFVLRPREVRDYLSFDPGCLLRPSLFRTSAEAPTVFERNKAMTSVWGLAHATIWYDAHGFYIPRRYYHDGVLTGPILTLLGLVPTVVMLLGLGAAGVYMVRSGGRSPDAPLFAMTVLGLAAFVVFTWRAPATVAVKGSYMLPLAVPAAAFFARGARLLGRRIRLAVLMISAVAALTSAIVFTNGLVYWFESGF